MNVKGLRMQQLKAKALWTCFSALLLASCGEPKRIVTNLAPPSERLQCVSAGARPIIPIEHEIDWAAVQTAAQARSQHDVYVRSVRAREGVVAGYIIALEGKLFACSNNAQWIRDWYAHQ